MASTIITKNGTGSAVPTSLQQGELAINVSNGTLFYGTSGSNNSVSSSFTFSSITASGDISSSGTITAEHFHSSDDATITDNLLVGAPANGVA